MENKFISSIFIQLICIFQIVFEGVVGNSYLGDIAIDDVWTYDGPCQRKYEKSHQGGYVGGGYRFEHVYSQLGMLETLTLFSNFFGDKKTLANYSISELSVFHDDKQNKIMMMKL